MGSQIDLTDVTAVKVRVKLSGRDVGMAEEFLDDAQIRPSLEHVGGKAVTKRMRMQPLDAHDAAGPRHKRVHALARESTTSVVEEHGRRRNAGVHELRAPILEIVAKNLRSRAHDGHDTLLVALAHNAQNLLVEKDAETRKPQP